MAIITFPNQLVSSVTWSLVTNTRKTESPWTKTVQIEEMDGARFQAKIQLRKLNLSEAKIFQAFLWECAGPVNTFLIEDPLLRVGGGAPSGLPTIQAGQHTSKTLPTQGWPVSQTVLFRGGYIEVDGSFRGVVADVVSDAGGLASISLSHRLYKAPIAASTVNHVNPKCEMRLVDDKQTGRRTTPPTKSDFSITVEEKINL